MFTTRKNDKSHLNFANYLLYLGMEWLKYSKDSYLEEHASFAAPSQGRPPIFLMGEIDFTVSIRLSI